VTTHIDSQVRNLDKWDGKKAERQYQGAQIAFEKRQSNGWQLQGSFLYSHGTGVAPRTTDQNWYIEGPMIMDTPFVSSPNQLVNNMSGPLPMLPKYSLKLAGSYTIPKVLVDLGGRLRYNTGRPFWPVEVVPQFAAWMDSLDGVILSTGSETGGSIVAVPSNKPSYLPSATILDLSLAREFPLRGDLRVGLHLDALNVLNEDAVNSASFRRADFGNVLSIENPRTFRLGIRFLF
jgi:outer membrane receptor protein involved in Fe transport